jgi:KipI family sensor histidine kinase inhibitor
MAPVGMTGMLVTFSNVLSESANRAALAFRAAVVRESWPGVEESSATLTSVFVGFDPLHLTHAALTALLTDLLGAADWHAAPPPEGRRRWAIPTVYGGEAGPQLADAAARAGMTPEAAAADLSTARVRVLTIGYGPGQPYLGALPPAWDLPRQTALTPRVPEGALVVAIRQFVLFGSSAPTGWRHVGETAFRCFRPETDDPFSLRPGDEVTFPAVTPETMAAIRSDPGAGNGGATCEALS